MTTILEPPIKVVLRIGDGSSRDPDAVSLRWLREIVAGRKKEKDFPRSSAMHLLALSDFPNKHRDLSAVLENEREPDALRRRAAILLGLINTPAATEILVKSCTTDRPQVLAGVLKSLGRVGGKTELRAVVKAAKYAEGHVATQAAFAAALISHREGLKGNDLPMPATSRYLKLPEDAARPIIVARAADSDAELCLRSLASQPFGIEYAEQPMYQLRCGRSVLLILINREFAGPEAVAKARERKAFLGVVATRIEETGSYSVTFLMLTSPARAKGKIDLLVTRTTGEPVFGGTIRVLRESARFDLRAISRPGAAGIEIGGTLAGGKLEITNARSALFAQVAKRQPPELPRRMKASRRAVNV